jgi:geranylgeranyl diphosphate synthase type I
MFFEQRRHALYNLTHEGHCMYANGAELSSLVASHTKAVDEAITGLFATVEPAGLRQALLHGAFGGKRIRPIITMLSCSAVGGNANDALQAATAIELLHTSSLVHDDIMDGAEVRRGVPTIHKRFGNSLAVLAGDTLIALAFQTMQTVTAPSKDRIMARFTKAFLYTCEGQGYDLTLATHDEAGLAMHRVMAEKKTARLLEAAASIGAMMGTTNEDYIRALGRFGFDLGLAFQAQDDLLDQSGDEKTLGKPVHADSRNGKLTYISVASGGEDTRTGKAWAEVAEQARALTRSACSVLDMIPPTDARENLRIFADALLERAA